MDKLFIIGIIFFLLPLEVFGAPTISSVSGNIQNGNNVTIFGSSFGSHADHSATENYLPVAWEDFEGGNADSDVWEVGSSAGPEIASDQQRTNSVYCAQTGGDSRNYTNVLGTERIDTLPRSFYSPNDANSSILFISGWFMFPTGTFYTLLHNVSEQCKFISTLSVSEEFGNQYWSVAGEQGDPYADVKMNFEDGRGAAGYGNELKMYAATGNDIFNENEWHRWDIAIDTTKGYGLKESRYYIDGREFTTDSNRYFLEECNDPCPRHFQGSYFIRYIRAAGWAQYFDDAFVNNTWARVEISENSTWDETTRYHKEIQIPIAWAAGEITITLNQGSFGALAGNYLFVVDSDGTASNGYLLSSGSSSSATFEGMTPVGMQYP